MSSGTLQTWANVIFGAALVLIVGSALHYSTRITSPVVPMQWDVGGNPTWFAPKLYGLWSICGLLVLLRAFFLVIEHYDGDVRVAVWYTVIAVSVGCLLLQAVYLWAVLRWAARH